AIILSLLYLVFTAARSFQRLPGIVRRYPLIIIHLLVLAGLVALSVFQDELGKIYPGLSRVIVAVILVLPLFVWRVGYLFLSVRNRRAKLGKLWEHFYYLLPIYGGMYVPYGKGHDY